MAANPLAEPLRRTLAALRTALQHVPDTEAAPLDEAARIGEAALRAHDAARAPKPPPAATRLTPALRTMLERIAGATDRRGSLMVLAITGSGGREPGKLRALIGAGWVETCDHALPRETVPGVRVTEAGRAALKGGA